MSLCSVQPRPGGVDPGPLDLLGDHQVVAEVVDAAAAVLLGHGHAQEAVLAGGWNRSRSTMPARSHSSLCGDDLGGDEPPDAVAEQIVLVVEQGAAHAADRTLAA